MYVPRGTPYIHRGTLREALAYPDLSDRFADRAYAQALERAGLRRYVQSLDADRRWDRELSEDEQMALSVARVILHSPRWVVFDDTFSAMEDETLRRVVMMCAQRITSTTIIHIGRNAHAHLSLFKRVLHLTSATGDTRAENKRPAERKLRTAV
jgi:putative ATP-binding cassette transporter